MFSNIDFSRLYSLLARQWGCFERIDAFEPDPVNYAQMTAQFFLNDAVLDIVSHKIAFSELTDVGAVGAQLGTSINPISRRLRGRFADCGASENDFQSFESPRLTI